jgi:hypothetical protein
LIYLTGHLNTHTDELVHEDSLKHMVGAMIQPGTFNYVDRVDAHLYPWSAMDNGRFSEWGRERYAKLGDDGYLDLLDRANERLPEPLLFATAPDVWGDWKETLRQSLPMLKRIRKFAPPAIVVQDGATPSTMPWDDISTVFIGGTNDWRSSDHLIRVCKAARQHNKLIHMGRVNSLKALRYAERLGCDSVDGTYILHRFRRTGSPLSPIHDVLAWLRDVNGPDPWLIHGEALKRFKCGLTEDCSRSLL